MRVKEAMKTPVRTIAPDQPLAEATNLMKQFDIEHLVVMDQGVPVGMLSNGDILRNPEALSVRLAMTHSIVTIDAEESIRRAANMMRGHGIKALVVTSDDDVAGVITSSDVLEVISRSGHKERVVMRDRGPGRHSRPI